MILEFADAWNFVVANTWFKKNEGRLITYEIPGKCRTVIDYFLIRKSDKKLIRDVKVIRQEECISGHKLIICVLDLKEGLNKRKMEFVKRCKVWKLRDDVTAGIFKERVQTRAALVVEKPTGAEEVWRNFKECLTEEAIEVCGETRGMRRHKESWWWNDEIAALVKKKQHLFELWKGPKKCRKGCRCEKTDGRKLCRRGKEVRGVDRLECSMGIESRKQEYYRARGAAKRAIFKAKDAERMKFCEDLEGEDRKGNVFRLAKQLVSKNRDVVSTSCVKDDDGKIVVEEDKLMEVWRAHYDKISNEEFAWDRNGLTNVSPVCGPCERISALEVGVAIGKMKQGKSAGPTGVVAEMLKAAGETGTLWMTEVCNAVVKDGKVPEDWSRSWMVNVYKGKGDALTCGSYRGIKLLEHAMKVSERVIEGRLRKIVKIDSMQFGFMSGRSTTDAIFIIRQLQEKYLVKNKELWMAFVDLEKAFDRVPREVVWWALRYLGVDEWIVSVIKAMYEDASTKVRMNGRESRAFNVTVGVHQGSVLSPLLFIIVLEALSREFREGLPMELLYADDVVLIAETKELLLEKVRIWKEGMEKKGLRVNAGKTSHVV